MLQGDEARFLHTARSHRQQCFHAIPLDRGAVKNRGAETHFGGEPLGLSGQVLRVDDVTGSNRQLPGIVLRRCQNSADPRSRICRRPVLCGRHMHAQHLERRTMVVFHGLAAQLVEAPRAEHDPLDGRPNGRLQVERAREPAGSDPDAELGQPQLAGPLRGVAAHFAQALRAEAGSFPDPDQKYPVGPFLPLAVE